jgi:hypothetical protein
MKTTQAATGQMHAYILIRKERRLIEHNENIDA